MNRIPRISFSVLLCLLGLCVWNCKDDDDNGDGNAYMEGILTHDLPSHIAASTAYTFHATGITKPTDTEGLSYLWVAPGFTPDTCKTAEFTCISPSTKGTFTMSLTVSCEGYNASYASPSPITIVVDTLFFESLSGLARGSETIIDPRDGQQYDIRAYGATEWFVQNLNWAGAGHPYGKIEALGAPLGRIYSWNEAVQGQTAANGPGQGPQGVCPQGWSLPTNEDWAELASHVAQKNLGFLDNWDGLANALCAYAKLNEDYIWPYSPRSEKDNAAEWNGLPGGRSSNNGNRYTGYKEYGFWWSASQANANEAYYRYVYYDNNQVPYHAIDKESFGASVRCVRLVVPPLSDEDEDEDEEGNEGDK